MEIKVLVFSSDNYDLADLESMTAKDRYELASTAKSVGYDETDVLTLAEYQDLFNSGAISPESCYIFFEQNA